LFIVRIYVGLDLTLSPFCSQLLCVIRMAYPVSPFNINNTYAGTHEFEYGVLEPRPLSWSQPMSHQMCYQNSILSHSWAWNSCLSLFH